MIGFLSKHLSKTKHNMLNRYKLLIRSVLYNFLFYMFNVHELYFNNDQSSPIQQFKIFHVFFKNVQSEFFQCEKLKQKKNQIYKTFKVASY